MTSLADELELDPAFNDLNLSQGRRGLGMPMSIDMEEDEDHHHRASSSVESSPVQNRRRAPFARRGRAAAMGNVSSDEEDYGPLAKTEAGFSLADELKVHGARSNGVSLADEGNDQDFNFGNIRQPFSNDTIDDEGRARKDQEHYLISSEIMGDSIRRTDAFLNKLRKIADTGTNSQGITSSTLPTSNSSNSILGGAPGIDDTASIEKTAAGIVRQLRNHTQLREGQVRELQEYDRILRRAFEERGDYLIALADSEEISEDSEAEITISPEERDPLGVMAAAAASLDRRDHPQEGSTFSDEGDDSTSLAFSPSQTFADTSLADLPRDQTAKGKATTSFQDLIGLQQSTSDLIVSLGAIHEHSQIAHASMGDAQRRIRNIRTVLTNWQEEIRSIEQSQSWIASWESGNLTDEAVQKRPDNIREWTQGQLDKFQRTLDEAHDRAQELLKPVKDPVLDRLATMKA